MSGENLEKPIVEGTGDLPLTAIQLRPGAQFAQARKDHVDRVEALCQKDPPSNMKERMMYDKLEFYCYTGTFSQSILSEIRKDSAIVLEVDGGAPVTNDENEPRQTSSWGLSSISDQNLPDWTCPSNGGEGIAIYILDGGFGKKPSADPEFDGKSVEVLKPDPDGVAVGHGLRVAQTAGGVGIGAAPKCKLFLVSCWEKAGDTLARNSNTYLASLNTIWLHMNIPLVPGGPEYSVINCSWGTIPAVSDSTGVVLRSFLKQLSKDTVIVCSAGNKGIEVPAGRIPVALSNQFKGPVTVGALAKSGTIASFSNWGTVVDLYAPGEDLLFPDESGLFFKPHSGTSYSAPMVAGILACWKGEMNDKEGKTMDAAACKKELRRLSGTLRGAFGVSYPTLKLYKKTFSLFLPDLRRKLGEPHEAFDGKAAGAEIIARPGIAVAVA